MPLPPRETREVIESESESEDHRQPIPIPIPVAIDGLEPMWQAPLMGNSWPASTENILFMCQINKAKYPEKTGKYI